MSTSGQQIGSSALEVLSYAQSVGVSLSERDGSLIYRGPDEAITQPLLAALRTHKDTILGLLRASVEDAEDQEHVQPLPPQALTLPSLVQERLWLVNQMSLASAATTREHAMRALVLGALRRGSAA